MDKDYAKYLLEKTRKDYNLIAEDFSRTRYSIWPELYILGKHVKKGEKVLDLGCGNGRLFELFQDKNIDYIGVDNSEKLIELAKKKYPEGKFQVGDALNLAFANNFFDKVYSVAVLHHIPSKELKIQFLKSVKRILKPGGVLILTVWKFHQFKEYYLILKYTLLKLIGKSKLDWGDIFKPWGKKIKRYYHCFSKKELLNLVKEVDFKIKEIGVVKNIKGNRQNIYLISEK